MDNHEIRLIILAQYYRSMFAENKGGNLPLDPRLKGISKALINANKFYLIEKGMMGGTIQHMGPHMFPFFSTITAHGIDVIEEIMNESLQDMRTERAAAIRDEEDPSTKFNKFYDMCIRAAPICEAVATVARAAFLG